jgi:hypothetical protein
MAIFSLRSVLKVITKGRGGQKKPNLDYVIYGWSPGKNVMFTYDLEMFRLFSSLLLLT